MRRLIALLALVAAAAAVVVLLRSPSAGGPAAGVARQRADSLPRRHRPRPVRGPHDRPVPILMYHVLAAPKPGAPYPELYTAPAVFSAQMRTLARRGYSAVTLAQVDRYWGLGYPLPRKPIVVSFDDGYLSDYTRALPVLRGLRWPGVLNLEVNNAVTRGDLSVPQVRAMIAAGWEIDSHTLTHPDLTTIPGGRLRDELVRSRAWLRRHLGVPAAYFCYPSGRFDARVEAAVRQAGYRMATTTRPGLARPGARFALDRIRVDGQDGVGGLLAKLAHPGTAQNASSAG